MEVERQQCPTCHSWQVENLEVRESGKSPTIYVRCCQCGELVARIQVAQLYALGRELESQLQGQGDSAAESGREVLESQRRIEEEVRGDFEKVVAALQSNQELDSEES